jgi:hypothetical protein
LKHVIAPGAEDFATSTPKIPRIPAKKAPKQAHDLVLESLDKRFHSFYIQLTPKRVLIKALKLVREWLGQITGRERSLKEFMVLEERGITRKDDILPPCFRTLKKRKTHVFAGIFVVHF